MKHFLAIYIGTESALERTGCSQLDEAAREEREQKGMGAWTTHFSLFPGDAVEIMECLPLPGQ
jgi:ribosomal protein S17